MHIAITGGCGFLGAALARRILQLPGLSRAGQPAEAVESITLIDQTAPPPDLASDPRIHALTGDLNVLFSASNRAASPVFPAQPALIFHLAAAVSGECEADFDLGLRSNIDATRNLLEACRALGTAPMLVFASSLAVFGNSPELPLPDVIDDRTLPTPQSSYGMQKFVGEQLVADYGRKGFVQSRNLRLMTVSVRPGKPNGAASSFLSGMVREPWAGIRAVCPVPPDTPVALASPGNTLDGLLRAVTASDAEWGARAALNLPALSTTPREIAEALAELAGPEVAALIDWKFDAAIARIVTQWPSRIHAARAQALGLQPDANIHGVIAAYLGENPNSARRIHPQ